MWLVIIEDKSLQDTFFKNMTDHPELVDLVLQAADTVRVMNNYGEVVPTKVAAESLQKHTASVAWASSMLSNRS